MPPGGALAIWRTSKSCFVQKRGRKFSAPLLLWLTRFELPSAQNPAPPRLSKNGESRLSATMASRSQTNFTLEVVEVMQFDRGCLSPCFDTHPEKMEAVLENTFILSTEKRSRALTTFCLRQMKMADLPNLPPPLRGRVVASLRQLGADRIVIAAPVIAGSTYDQIRRPTCIRRTRS